MMVGSDIVPGERWCGMADARPDGTWHGPQVNARRRALHGRRLAAPAAERERHECGQRAKVKRSHDIAPAKFRRRANPRSPSRARCWPPFLRRSVKLRLKTRRSRSLSGAMVNVARMLRAGLMRN